MELCTVSLYYETIYRNTPSSYYCQALWPKSVIPITYRKTWTLYWPKLEYFPRCLTVLQGSSDGSCCSPSCLSMLTLEI